MFKFRKLTFLLTPFSQFYLGNLKRNTSPTYPTTISKKKKIE